MNFLKDFALRSYAHLLVTLRENLLASFCSKHKIHFNKFGPGLTHLCMRTYKMSKLSEATALYKMTICKASNLFSHQARIMIPDVYLD